MSAPGIVELGAPRWLRDAWARFLAWRAERTRFLFQFGAPPGRAWYVRLTPNVGVGIGWPARVVRAVQIRGETVVKRYTEVRPRRVIYAAHKGIQLVEWRSYPNGVERWEVARQIMGRDRTIYR